MRILIFVFIVLSSFGCVTQKTYDTLKADRDALGQSLSERDKALAQLEALERKQKARIAETEGALQAEQNRIRDLSSRIDRLLADMAAAAKDKSKLQASINDMTQALNELERRRAEAEARVQEFKQLLARFRTLIDAGKLKVKIVDGAGK